MTRRLTVAIHRGGYVSRWLKVGVTQIENAVG